MPVEAANILRRATRTGQLSTDSATLAHRDLLALRVELFPYSPCAARLRAPLDRHGIRRVPAG